MPERHTDFIFAVLAEELGLVGILILLALYILLIMCGARDCRQSANPLLGRVMAGGLMLLFVYVFVNIGMVKAVFCLWLRPYPLVITGPALIGAWMAVWDCDVDPHPQKNVVEKRIRVRAMRKQLPVICVVRQDSTTAACTNDGGQQQTYRQPQPAVCNGPTVEISGAEPRYEPS